jgi:hypothetical protein
MYLQDPTTNKYKTATALFCVTNNEGAKLSPATINNGLSRDRGQIKLLDKVSNDWINMTQQLSHFADKEAEPIEDLNEGVRRAAGLSHHIQSDNKKNRNLEEIRSTTPTSLPSRRVNFSVGDVEIIERMGFRSYYTLISCVAVAVNGDVEKFNNTATRTLTWLEELMLYFEWLWGQEGRMRSGFAQRYEVGRTTVSTVIDECGKRVASARNIWPRSVSLEEDREFMALRWREVYGDRDNHYQFWDDINVDIHSPSDHNINRVTYSSYHGGNVAKGDVGLQLCGWITAWELYAGSIYDTDYISKRSFLSFQKDFVEKCNTHSNIPFTSILDKGYRCALAAWRSGKQLILQPSFARSDRKFNTKEVLHSASIASDWSDNERAVNVSKRSDYVKRGLGKHENTATIAEAWPNWSFQSNFMFLPVLKVIEMHIFK